MRQRLFTRNFLFLILGQSCSLLGNYGLKFALSMYVLERTGSAAVFSGLLALSMVPTILLSPFGGILADRANRKWIMVSLDALSGACVLAGGGLLGGGGDLTAIAVLLLALSILGAFESPTVQACIPQMLSGDNVLRGNAVVNQVQAVAGLITPFLGSVIYTALGLRAVLYGAAALFFATAGLECMIRLSSPSRPESGGGLWAVVRGDLAASGRFLCREQPGVLRLLLLAALISMCVVGTVTVGFPYLVRTVLGLSAELYGAAESAMGGAAILGSLAVGLLAGRLRLGRLHWFMVGAGCLLIPAGLAFLSPLGALGRYLVLLAAFCGCQFAGSVFSIYALSEIQRRTPAHLTGKVMALVYTFSLCAQPAAQLIYGGLFDCFSRQVYVVLIPSGLLVCAIAGLSAGFFRQLEAS